MRSQLQILGTLEIYEFVPGTVVRQPVGNIETWVYRRAARRVARTHNLVTDVGLRALAALIAGGLGVHEINGSGYGPANFQSLRVSEMRLTDDQGASAPAPADVALEGSPVHRFGDQYPSGADGLLIAEQLATAGEVRFSGLLEQHQLVGSILAEEGLFADSGELVARTTFSYEKTDDVAVQFDHTLSLARA